MSSDSSQEFEHGLPVYGPCPSPLSKNELQELAKPGTVDAPQISTFRGLASGKMYAYAAQIRQ